MTPVKRQRRAEYLNRVIGMLNKLNEVAAERQRIAEEWRKFFRGMSPQERLAFLHAITADFCTACGSDLSGACHCTNDE